MQMFPSKNGSTDIGVLSLGSREKKNRVRKIVCEAHLRQMSLLSSLRDLLWRSDFGVLSMGVIFFCFFGISKFRRDCRLVDRWVLGDTAAGGNTHIERGRERDSVW